MVFKSPGSLAGGESEIYTKTDHGISRFDEFLLEV